MGTPSSHMSNVPSGSANKGLPGTSLKSNARTPASPGAATGNPTPALPLGSQNVGPPATSTKSNARTPASPSFATGAPKGGGSSGGAHGAKDSIGGNTGR